MFHLSGDLAAFSTPLVIGLSVTALASFLLWAREHLLVRNLKREATLTGDRLRRSLFAAGAFGWDWDVTSGRDEWFGDLKTTFGISGDRYVGNVEDFRRRIHSDDRQRVWQAVNDARVGRTNYHAKFRLMRSDGTVRWLDATGKFYYAADGEPIRMLGIATDITQRVHLEDRLRQSQELLTGLVASAMDAIVAVDETQQVIVFNHAAEKMFGCTAADALGSPLERFVPERLRDAHTPVPQFGGTSVTSGAVANRGELRALRATGDEFPIEASISSADLGSQRISTVIVRDVTERKRSEEALRESEQRFRTMADSAPIMLWISGLDKGCTYFNHTWLEFTGRPLDAELGNGWLESVHAHDLERCLGTYSQAFDAREPFRMEYRLRRHDGEYRWVIDTGVPRFTSEGVFAGYIGSALDVTKLKLAEDMLSSLSRTELPVVTGA